jgi:putative hydrolase of the HAD superfamily
MRGEPDENQEVPYLSTLMASMTLIRVFLFDFGGVIADEGFYHGLRAIGSRHGLDPDAFFRTAESVIAETGYLTGKGDEALFWAVLRERTGVNGTDRELRQEILSRFMPRPAMLTYVDRIRARGRTAVILSDQTNWLEEIDADTSLFSHFDRVFNSYRTGKSKHDATVFRDVCSDLEVKPDDALFIDDNEGHILRAESIGLRTLLFTDQKEFASKIAPFIE